jgi:hypothetical protein
VAAKSAAIVMAVGVKQIMAKMKWRRNKWRRKAKNRNGYHIGGVIGGVMKAKMAKKQQAAAANQWLMAAKWRGEAMALSQ